MNISIPAKHSGSVLPHVAGTRIPGGFRLQQKRQKSLSLAIAAVFAASAIAGGLFTVRDWLGAIDPKFLLSLVFLVVMAAIVARRTFRRYAAYMRQVWRFQNLGGMYLNVRPWPLRLGEHVKFELIVSRRSQVNAERAESRIECFEDCMTARDDNPVVAVRRVIKLDEAPIDASDAFVRLEWSADIPRNEPASFRAAESSVEWRFVSTVYMSGGTYATAVFPLLIVPQVPA